MFAFYVIYVILLEGWVFFLCRLSVVNTSLVDYFLDELQINQHFEALRSFLIMHDGEFSQTLSEQLFDKVNNFI